MIPQTIQFILNSIKNINVPFKLEITEANRPRLANREQIWEPMVPKGPKWRPKGPQGTPKATKGSQMEPKGSPKDLKGTLGESKGTPKESQREPKSLPKEYPELKRCGTQGP